MNSATTIGTPADPRTIFELADLLEGGQAVDPKEIEQAYGRLGYFAIGITTIRRLREKGFGPCAKTVEQWYRCFSLYGFDHRVGCGLTPQYRIGQSVQRLPELIDATAIVPQESTIIDIYDSIIRLYLDDMLKGSNVLFNHFCSTEDKKAAETKELLDKLRLATGVDFSPLVGTYYQNLLRPEDNSVGNMESGVIAAKWLGKGTGVEPADHLVTGLFEWYLLECNLAGQVIYGLSLLSETYGITPERKIFFDEATLKESSDADGLRELVERHLVS